MCAHKALILWNVRLCRTKADAHDKFGFWVLIGSSCNKIDLLTKTLRFDIIRNQAKTNDSCANTVQSLSLSLSLLLRPAIKVCSLDPEDRPACLIRGKHVYQEL